jgi:hypothetical protein
VRVLVSTIQWSYYAHGTNTIIINSNPSQIVNWLLAPIGLKSLGIRRLKFILVIMQITFFPASNNKCWKWFFFLILPTLPLPSKVLLFCGKFLCGLNSSTPPPHGTALDEWICLTLKKFIENLQLWPWHTFIGTRVGRRTLMPSFLLILSQITQLLLHF